MDVAKKTQATTNSIFISSHGLSTRDCKCNHYTIGVSVLPSQQPSIYLDYKKGLSYTNTEKDFHKDNDMKNCSKLSLTHKI
jgi:hypothetical protein